MTAPNVPNTQIVVAEWLNTIPALQRPSGVAGALLPRDNSSWGASGFIVVRPTGGGRHNSYLPVARPAVTLRFYAVKPGTTNPLWHVANNMLMAVVNATRDEDSVRRHLSLEVNGRDYGKAYVASCYPINHERRSPEDPGDYACLVLDCMFHWIPLE